MLQALLLAGAASAAAAPVSLEVVPLEATVGDRLSATVSLDVPEGWTLDTGRLGTQWGKFAVVSGSWSEPVDTPEGQRWEWTGTLSAFEPGTLQVPPVELRISDGSETRTLTSEPVEVRIVPVLSEQEQSDPSAELADLKPPASLKPDYRALGLALALLAALLACAGVVWWLQRRYASRLAAVPAPFDPFHRTPPEVWVYGELKKLLDKRLPERGQVDRFFVELSWIVKRYLGGRYRVELLEHTTAEVAGLLAQARVDAEVVSAVRELLACCDRVKFAGVRPDPNACRAAVEEAYRIVDRTKPSDRAAAEPTQGAA